MSLMTQGFLEMAMPGTASCEGYVTIQRTAVTRAHSVALSAVLLALKMFAPGAQMSTQVP